MDILIFITRMIRKRRIIQESKSVSGKEIEGFVGKYRSELKKIAYAEHKNVIMQ